jgi:transposase
MEKRDARKLGLAAQAEVRRLAVAQRESGLTHGEIAKNLSVHRGTVTRWLNEYRRDAGAIGLKRRGRFKGQGGILSAQQCNEIQKLIRDRCPDQLKLPFVLWTCGAVMELIKTRFHVNIGRSTVALYLKRWGFTPQKPAKRAAEQQPEQVKKWLAEVYPTIVQQAKDSNADIHWGDESGIRNDCQHGRSYAPKGKTPIRLISAKRFSVNMIASITNKGKVQFLVFQENFNADVFIEFLERLSKSSERQIFLILDNCRVHHSKPVKEWVANQEKIKLFFLPAYSPELNPEELLNNDVKAKIYKDGRPRNRDSLHRKLEDYLTKLSFMPTKIASFFQHPQTAYAAAA